MGGITGGGETQQQSQVQQQTPQISPYSLPGYVAASNYYLNNLGQPPVYPGPTLAPPGSGQLGAIDNAYSLYGGRR